jgi:Flp pilus assembly pilin Flp
MIDRVHELRDQAGQTMAEYAVVLAVITIAVVVTLGFLSDGISTELNSVIGIL